MFIKNIIRVFVIFPLLLATVKANNKKNVVCYHGSWSFYRKSLGHFDITTAVEPHLCTHLIYAFASLNDIGQLFSKDLNFDRENYKKFNALKLKNPHLKTLLSVGGSQMSINFAITAADPVKRNNLLQSALSFLSSNGFDGLDLDWEYPNRNHNLKNSHDRENYVELLKHLKEGFKPHSYLLTAAVGPAEYTPQLSYNIPEMVKYLDFINIMAYDLHGPWESTVGHNAPLFPGVLETTERAKQHSFDGLAKYWIAQGAPRNKLVMGLPFYGRSYALKDPNFHGIGAPHIGVGIAGQYTRQSGTLVYNEICEKLKNEKSNWHYEWDDTQKVPFIHYNSQWISYENENSIGLKVDYVNKENLGGIMIWTIEMDDFRGLCGAKHYPLLSLIKKRLGN